MRRRDLLLLGTAAIAWPTVARPQTSGGIVPVIGFLGSASAAAWQPGPLLPVRRGLNETGFTEGKNIVVEYRWADDHYDRLPALAVELAQKDIAVLVAPGTVAAAKAAMAATRTIPIVFMIASDPVEAGLVSSFNHPGGNVTGVGYLNAQLASKRLQLLHEAVPAAATITLLVNPANPVEAESQTKELQAAAPALGLQLRVAEVTTLDEIERVFKAVASDGKGAIQLSVDPLFGRPRPMDHEGGRAGGFEVVAIAARYAVPTVYPWREFVQGGGLMSYGSLIGDAFRNVGVYAGHILNGEKPSDLPVERPTRFYFALNLKTAKDLNLTIPPTLVGLADTVIE
jgi:putative tryptophan/tyrosine transport system substrate-binding protein